MTPHSIFKAQLQKAYFFKVNVMEWSSDENVHELYVHSNNCILASPYLLLQVLSVYR